jgi:hypothetical protein
MDRLLTDDGYVDDVRKDAIPLWDMLYLWQKDNLRKVCEAQRDLIACDLRAILNGEGSLKELERDLRAYVEEMPKTLPTIDEFIGSDPDFTGEKGTREYIKDMRGEK